MVKRGERKKAKEDGKNLRAFFLVALLSLLILLSLTFALARSFFFEPRNYAREISSTTGTGYAVALGRPAFNLTVSQYGPAQPFFGFFNF